ncbi:MAG: 4-hydroxythreonine-4-phosphate dehydrogenase PdxA [Bacteroidales bacterium]|nr:4-hydroxythreonine-4-phosphate dehydrogenase PdxA [Bacteroidales bacterium]
MARKLTVGITQGDGNGIGYEVIIKALADERMLDMFTPVIYGSSKIFGFYRKQLHDIEQLNTNVISSAKDVHAKRINIVNCLPDNIFVEPGQPTPESAKAAMTALKYAVDDIKAGYIDVLVTAPINKQAMVKEGFGFTGHTDYLEKEFGSDHVMMIMCCDQMKVGCVTGHIPLSKVVENISTDRILRKLRLMKSSLQRDFGVPSPKIAVLGLNPHNGHEGLIGSEEQEIIAPAVKAAQEEGILAFGPFSPDGFFGLGRYADYDCVLAMYHDQGLTPFKALAYELGVNYTAGLPIVRTSPDHGTAYEMAGHDKADPRSMMSSIFTAIDVYNKRIEYDDLEEGKMTIKAPDTEIKPRGGKIIE